MNNLGRLIAVLFLTLLSNSVLADVSAHLNQNTFYEGDTITLTIESNMNTLAKPDLSILEANYAVVGTGTNAQINIFNGERSFKRVWTIEMRPKTNGTLEIPSITIGNEKTAPLSIKVIALPPEIKAETEKHVFLETSVGTSNTNTNETYVQQQIPYTVKFFFDSTMQSGEISQPDVENSVVEELTRDKRYTVMRGGKKFTVIEKHFSISPEKSGILHIPATTVSGKIALSKADAPQKKRRMDDTDILNKFFGNDPFMNDPFFRDQFRDSFFRGRRQSVPSKPFTIKSNTIDINVLPVPKAFTGLNWLPAEELNVRDSWTRTPPELKVGEPVTRTLILRAKGLSGSQIPTTLVAKPDNVKIYPQQATSKTHTDGITLIGRQSIEITYIPQKSGEVSIPEIKVDWWNTKTKKQETFTLPAWHLKIAAGTLGTATEEVKKPAVIAPDTEPQNDEDTLKINQSTNESKDITSDSWNWKPPLLYLTLLIALAGLFYGIKKLRKKSLQNSSQLGQASKKQIQININALKKEALQACNNNDKNEAKNSLLKLLQAQWNDSKIQNLGMIISTIENEKSIEVIKDLEKSLYAPNAEPWNGTNLKKLIEVGLQQKQDNRNIVNDEPLSPLYPS